MNRLIVGAICFVLSTHNVVAEWWGLFSDDKPLISVYEDNEPILGSMSSGVYELDNVFFSKVVAPSSVIKSSRSWGKLKLQAQQNLSDFLIKKRLGKLSVLEQEKYKPYVRNKAVIKFQGGMVVKKLIETGDAILIFGVPFKGALFKTPYLK